MNEDRLDDGCWTKPDCGCKECSSKTDDDKLCCVRVCELDIAFDELIAGSFLSCVLLLIDNQSSYGRDA